MQTDRYEYETNQKLDMFFENHPNIKLNGQTGLYDVDGDIAIRDVDIICGKLPVKFGTVTRNFDLDTNELVTLEGCPKHVKGCCMICCQAIDTDSLPKFVDGTFTLELPIRSLQGIGTKEVGANFIGHNAEITDINFNEMDWSDEGSPLLINLTIQPDYCILQY